MAVAVLVCKHAVFGQLLVLPEKEHDPFSAEGHRYVSLLNTHQHPNADSRIDVTYYRLNLHITTSPNFLGGVVTLKAISKVEQLATLSLDLTNTLMVDSIKMESVSGRYGIQQYRNRMQETMTTAKRAVGPLVKIDTSVVRALFDQPTVYRKGASVLHMLRRVVGDSVFFLSLKSYVADPRFRFGVALSEDFQFVCETVSQQSVGWFFQQWLYGEKYPTYSFSWSSVQHSNGYEVTVNLSQSTGTANPAFFTMPVDFRFSTDDWDTTVTFFNDANPQQFSAILSRRPAKVELDPDNWILRDIQTNPAIPVDFRLRPNYPNPFNGSTVIEYEVPRAAFVTLAVFNLLGQQVRTLVNETVYPGLHRTTFEADGLPSGVYYYRLQAGETFRTRTAVVIR